MEREMKFGQHFGQRYDEPRDFNSFYSKPHNMTPEEMKLYMRRKKIAGTFNSMNFVVTCLVIFMFIIVSESFYVRLVKIRMIGINFFLVIFVFFKFLQ